MDRAALVPGRPECHLQGPPKPSIQLPVKNHTVCSFNGCCSAGGGIPSRGKFSIAQGWHEVKQSKDLGAPA